MSLPLAAATPVAGIIADLFIILLAAKLGDELFKRIDQPALIGEILAGVIVGPAVLGVVEPTETFEVFAELGVVFLLFWVGLETRLSEMFEVGRPALLVGLLGVVLPLAGGVGLAFAIGEPTATAIFVGVALVATSVGITSAVLIELGAVGSRAGRTILGAAVIDDILAMLLLAVAVGLGQEGGLDVTSLLVTVGMAVAFVCFFALGGTRLFAQRPALLHEPKFSESPLLPAVIICLGLAAFAAEIGLAAIIGAFLAGMMIAETKEQHPIEEEVGPLYAFFPPFFFVFIGTEVELGEFTDGGTVLLLLGVTALAFATKYVGAWLGARGLPPGDAKVIALGMVPRGEVGIIVAGIGAAAGVVEAQLFAVIVGMSVATTVMIPPLLRGALAEQGARSP